MVTVAVLWGPSQSSYYIPLWPLTLTRHCPRAYCESFMVEEEHPSTATISEIQQTCHHVWHVTTSKSLSPHAHLHAQTHLSCCWLSKQLTVVPNTLASDCVINVNVTISNINAFYTFPGQNTHPCILRYAGAVLAVEWRVQLKWLSNLGNVGCNHESHLSFSWESWWP